MQGVAAVKYGGPWEKRGIEFTLQCERKMGLHGGGGSILRNHFKPTQAFHLLQPNPTDQKFLIDISRELYKKTFNRTP